MQRFLGIPSLALAILRLFLVALMGMLVPAAIRGQNPPPNLHLFDGDVPFRAIGYQLPDGAWPNTLPPLCLLARDLPLIAESGATVLYTRGAPPEDGDHVFLSLLATTRLSWVAAFPLPAGVDPSRSLLHQKPALLAAFASFAERYSGNRSLRGVTLDFSKDHLAEAALLAPDFAAILLRYFPANRPLLGLAAYSPSRLDAAPPAIEFWLYRFEDGIPTNSTRLQLRQRTTLPIVFDVSSIAYELLPAEGSTGTTALTPPWRDYLNLFRGSDTRQPLLALNFLGRKEVSSQVVTMADNGASTTTVSYRFRKDGLFVCSRDTHLFEHLEATPLLAQQRTDWGAPAMESHAAPPRVEQVRNAATMNNTLAPGAQVRVQGSLFQLQPAETAQSTWPLHAGARSICAGGRPIPIGALGGNEALAQLPWLLPEGKLELRFVRDGVASAPLPVEPQPYAPGIFADSLARTGSGANGCSVSLANGLKPGETLELRVTGTGPLNGNLDDLRVSLDGTPAPVSEAGLVSDAPGVARLTVRIPQASATGSPAGLYIRRGSHASNLLAISYAGNARPSVGLVASAAGLQVQAGGVSVPLKIETQGLNGYCGPVDFEVMGLPNGITASIARVEAGKAASLSLRADGSVLPAAGKFPFYLYALPLGGDLRMLSLEVTVLERANSVVLGLESAGYAAGSQATVTWAGTVLAGSGIPQMRGLLLVVINPLSGLSSPVERYDIYDSVTESTRLETRLTSLPAGTIVGMAVADDATLGMQASLRALIQAKFGSTAIAALGYQHSWAFIGRAGAAPLAEATAPKQAAKVQATLQFTPR